jgi:threonine-phosphate decarboxylase
MSTNHNILLPSHGGQLRQIAAQYGFSAEQLLDFSANINPAGPPPSVLVALRQSLADHAPLVTYPDLELAELRWLLANKTQVSREHICVANGFVPLLESTLRSLKIKRCLLPVPCFSEYRRTLENANVDVFPHLLLLKNSFRYQPDSIVQALLDHSCDAILLANPQNPSGILFEAEAIYQLIEMTAQQNITVLLDEAFIDYSPSQSLTQKSAERSNLIVFRSVTKFFAIPGLRVAYAVSNALMAKSLRHFLAPWPVSALASIGVCAALRDDDDSYAHESRTVNHRRRAWLETELARLNIFTYPSSANFLLLRFPAEVDVRSIWERMIVEEQIVLRSCENFEGLGSEHLRIAVRSEAENMRLIDGLERMLMRSNL